MDQPTPPGGSLSDAGSPRELLHDTIAQLEDVRARAGSADIAERLRTVCDRLRSMEAALRGDGERASAEPQPRPRRAAPERSPTPANETERY